MNFNNSSATSMAEGDPTYKMDVSVVFGGRCERDKVLRTTLDRLDVWESKYVNVNASPFKSSHRTAVKDAAMIDKEVWVFGIDSTNANDIVTAIEIAADKHKAPASSFLKNIYIKNLNAEREHEMANKAIIEANRGLYKGVSEAIRQAAEKLRVKGELNLWVISSNLNEKIPKKDLHEALREGGADAVGVAKKEYRFYSGSNDGLDVAKFKTNLHLAKFNI